MNMASAFLTAAAVIPAVYLMIRVYRMDRLEKEPIWLLITLVGLGLLACLLAYVLERSGSAFILFFVRNNSPVYRFLEYFLVVACSEEGSKYLLLKKKTWNSPEFNCLFDGVVYAVFISLGFALWENIGYVFQFGMITALIRAITAVPEHGSLGVFMGVYYGMARQFENQGNSEKAKECRRHAVLIPILLHGAYDFLASGIDSGYTLKFTVFVIIQFLVTVRLAKKMSRNDRDIENPLS